MAPLTLTDALIEVSQTINSGAGLITILAAAKDVAVRLIGAERASVFILDRARSRIWTLLADGTQMIRVPEGKGIVGEVIRSNTTINVPDVASDSRFFGDVDRRTGFVTRSILCAPMCNRHGKAFGALELLNKKGGVFTAEDERVLAIFGAQAGLAIEHVEMYEDLQQNLRQFQLLYSIQDNINAAMDLHQIFEEILAKLLPLVGGVSGVIYIVLGSKATYYGYKPGDGLVTWEPDEARQCPAFLRDLIDAAATVANRLSVEHFCSLPDLVCAELTRGERNVGYLAVRLERDASRLFNERPVDYLKVIAAQTVSFLDKKEALDERKRSEKQALLGSMLSMIVHDMKNPLCGASGYAQLIRQRTSDDSIRMYSTKILEVLERLERMNNELLMFVRGDTVQLDKTDLDLKDLFDQYVASCADSFQHLKIAVTVRSEGDEPIRIAADRDRLLRAFGNIITNAREAMTDEGGTIDISLARAGPERVTIRIRDTGTGMPAHIKQRIFEPFVTYGKKNGTGLGMAIVRTIIERHGGTIDVDSTLGKGTVFTIHLPVSS